MSAERPEYTFRNNYFAELRMQVLSEVLEPSSKAFLRETVPRRPRLALDLGCGPGFTTTLLADTLGCEHVCGLDNSEYDIVRAQKKIREGVSFHLHDVTKVPFPVGPADLAYGRLLLTHLKDPEETVAAWTSQLNPKGLLLIEEVEDIETQQPLFSSYLQIVEALLVHQSQKLYVGPLLDRMDSPDNTQRKTSRVRRVSVANDTAATFFFLNITSWKTNPFIKQNYSQDTIDEMQEALADTVRQQSEETGIEWVMRQMVFEAQYV